VVRGPGNVVGGTSLLLRYNFVQPNYRVVPYIQGGAGILFNDIYKDHTQNAVGQVQEFALEAAVGFHYLVHPNWSVDLEGDFFHISNAGMSRRNAGLNSLGGMVGVTYYFHKIRKF
jgi:lipid A 3-O-deacylase